jgi:hypothetical protein
VDVGPEDLVDQMTERHAALLDADKRHRREKGHDPLRVVEDARGLEDQDEAQRHQRVHHPVQKAVQRDLHGENQLVRHRPLLPLMRMRQSWATPR